MAITFDPAKREVTLIKRGLDFREAEAILNGSVFEFADDRIDYGETRITTVGLLNQRMVIVVWTQRDRDCHVISMRKANAREQQRYQSRLG